MSLAAAGTATNPLLRLILLGISGFRVPLAILDVSFESCRLAVGAARAGGGRFRSAAEGVEDETEAVGEEARSREGGSTREGVVKVAKEVEDIGEEERRGVEGTWISREVGLDGGELERIGGGGEPSARSRGRADAAVTSTATSEVGRSRSAERDPVRSGR